MDGVNVAFGGGPVSSAKLTTGTHWFICENHASSGMKGMIIISSLGLPENQLHTNISIFPNPSTDLITFKTSENLLDSTYFVADDSGRQVLTGKLNETTTSVDISQLTKGVYFFVVAEEKKQSVKKVIKK